MLKEFCVVFLPCVISSTVNHNYCAMDLARSIKVEILKTYNLQPLKWMHALFGSVESVIQQKKARISGH